MPEVPVYQNAVSLAAPSTVTPRTITPSEDVLRAGNAYLGQVQNVAKSFGNIGQALSERIAEHEKMNAQQRAAKYDIEFRNEAQDLTNNPEIEEVSFYENDKRIEVKRPKGILLREGENAKNSTIDFQNKIELLREKYLSQAGNDYERNLLSSSIGNYTASLKNQVLNHESTQLRKSYNDSINSGIKLRIADASKITDPELLKNETIEIGRMISERDSLMGVDKNTSALNYANTVAAVTKNAVEAMAEKDARSAQRLFDGVKENLVKADQDKIQESIDNKAILERGINIWGQVKTFTLADGSPNVEAMFTAIDGQKDLTLSHRERIKTFVKSKAAEANTQRLASIHANDRSFQNAVLKMKNDPSITNKFDAGMALVGAYAIDGKDNEDKKKILDELLNQQTTGNRELAYAYTKAADTGAIDRGFIEKEYKEGKINLSQRNTVLDTLDKYVTNSENKEKRAMDQRIESIIRQQTPNKERQADLLYQYREATIGKDANESFAIYKDLIAPAEGTGIFGFFATPNYRANTKTLESSSLAWNKLYMDMGKQTALTLKDSLSRDAGKEVTPEDINSLSQRFGGYNSLKIGGPVNNAIQSLKKYNKPITVKNIEAVIQQTGGTGNVDQRTGVNNGIRLTTTR